MSETPVTRKAAVWVAIVFLLGVAVGGIAGYGYARRSVSLASAPQPEPVRRAHRVEQLTGELGLTSDQAKQLDAILLQWHGQMKAIHDQTDSQIEQLRQKGRDEIRAILTPEQKPKFEEFLRQIDEQRKRNVPK
jgi:Spy/CpxP family protein refolding chaperone